MQIVRSLENFPPELQGGAVTIGNFDGVHRGHACLIQRLVQQARNCRGPAVVFTFDPHPLALLKPEWLPVPMTRIQRKAQLLGELGVDGVIAYPTNRDLLDLEPHEFFQRVLQDCLAARAIVEGPNFHFGRERAGNVARLAELCQTAAITLEILEPQQHAGELISSSRVRQLIFAGEVSAANEMLTQPYRLRGVVGHGAARGGKIGFPTANLEQVQTALPALGVYAARAWVGEQSYVAAVNIGPNPTFGEQAVKIEAHLLDFAGNLYDQILELEFLTRLREIQTFPNLEALTGQLQHDMAQTRKIVAALPRPSE